MRKALFSATGWTTLLTRLIHENGGAPERLGYVHRYNTFVRLLEVPDDGIRPPTELHSIK